MVKRRFVEPSAISNDELTLLVQIINLQSLIQNPPLPPYKSANLLLPPIRYNDPDVRVYLSNERSTGKNHAQSWGWWGTNTSSGYRATRHAGVPFSQVDT